MFRNSPGFLSTLQNQLESLPMSILEHVNREGGLETADLLSLIVKPKDHSVAYPDIVDDQELIHYSNIDKEAASLGASAYREGIAAFCILAGGSDTRLGDTKGLMKLPESGKTLLQLKLEQAAQANVKHVWVMSSPSNRGEIVDVVNSIDRTDNVRIFEQYESLRLSPENLLHSDDGKASLHPCGHGDVVPALAVSGILSDFKMQGGKYISVVNVDNVLAKPDPGLMGLHIKNETPVSCEVVISDGQEAGGYLCNYFGANQIVEKFRFIGDVDFSQYKWLSTNSMIFDARLDFDTIRWSWHRVKKQINEKIVIQHERLLQELTSIFKTRFIVVPRELRFAPVKSTSDLFEAEKLLDNEKKIKDSATQSVLSNSRISMAECIQDSSDLYASQLHYSKSSGESDSFSVSQVSYGC